MAPSGPPHTLLSAQKSSEMSSNVVAFCAHDPSSRAFDLHRATAMAKGQIPSRRLPLFSRSANCLAPRSASGPISWWILRMVLTPCGRVSATFWIRLFKSRGGELERNARYQWNVRGADAVGFSTSAIGQPFATLVRARSGQPCEGWPNVAVQRA